MFGNHREHIDRIELISWLETIERNIDPLLLKGRNRFNEAEGWILIWLFRSLLGTSYEKMPEDSVNKILALFLSKWQKVLTYLGLVGVVGVPLVSEFQLSFWQAYLASGGTHYHLECPSMLI